MSKGTVMHLFHGPDGPYISVQVGGAATLWYRSDAQALFDRLALGMDPIVISDADDARLRAPRKRKRAASANISLKDLGL